MALIIRDPEVEELAAAVAKMAGESKTEAIVKALAERRDRLARESPANVKVGRLRHWLETELWPSLPEEVGEKASARKSKIASSATATKELVVADEPDVSMGTCSRNTAR